MEKKIYNQIYYQENRERELKRVRIYRQLNAEKIKERRRKWYKKYGKGYRKKHLKAIRKSARKYARSHKKPYSWSEKNKEYQQRYRLKYKEKIAQKRRIKFHERLSNDVNFHLIWLLRSRVMIAIKKQLADKAYKTIELLGCLIQTAREHIENQFNNEMTWENHGKLWEIDHRIPISSFDLTKPENQKKAFHWTNLQPLIKQENRSKGSKLLIG